MRFDYLIEDCVAVHKGTKVNKAVAEQIIKDVFENIKKAMVEGEGISIRGFGSFKPINKKGRTYLEPKTQRPIEKGPSVYPKFVPSSKLKELLND